MGAELTTDVVPPFHTLSPSLSPVFLSSNLDKSRFPSAKRAKDPKIPYGVYWVIMIIMMWVIMRAVG